MLETRPLITVGFSPCPNDTFIFHALVHGLVDLGGASIIPVIDDVEALNLRVITGVEAPALSKISVGALGHVLDRYRPIDVGAALGRGVGPLVVTNGDSAEAPADAASAREALAELAGRRVLTPGENTTAHALLRMFAPDARCTTARYDQIMPAVAAGRAEAGVIIHEGRFTYAGAGLKAIADLGAVWELETGLPLPLGVLAVHRELDEVWADALLHGLRESLARAHANPQIAWPWIRENAQELDEAVCREHIALYVNEFSRELGEEGRAAIEEFIARARSVGLIPDGPSAFA